MIPILLVGILIYIVLAYRNALNPDFQQKCLIDEKIYLIRRLNNESFSLHERIKKRVARRLSAKIFDKVSSMLGISNLPTFEERIDKIENIKEQVISDFLINEYSSIKQKIAQKTVELAIVYYKLMFDYFARIGDVSPTSLNSIHNRKESNRRKITSCRNPYLSEQLKSAVEADEKLIKRLYEQKHEVDKMAVELSVIESTMSLLKHQYYSQNLNNEAIINEIDNTVNEAVALESALHQHYHRKIKRNA
jgi:hypothetical protein